MENAVNSAAPQKSTKRARPRKGPSVTESGSGTVTDVLANSLGYAVRRAQVRCDEALERILDAGMSPARLSALSTIGINPGISQTVLSAKLNIAGPSVVKVVDALEQLGLLTRETISDRRSYSLQLTNSGIAELHRYKLLVDEYEQQIAASLSTEERTLLLTLLTKVAPMEP